MEILTRAITSAQPISVNGEKVNNDIIIWWGRLIMSGSLIGRLIMPESLVLKGWTRTAHVWAFSAVQRFREKHSEYLIDASEDLRSFGCTRGLVVMDWSAPAVLVGRVEEASSSSVCWVDSVEVSIILVARAVDIMAPCTHACWPAVDSYIYQLSSVRWSWLVSLHRNSIQSRKGRFLDLWDWIYEREQLEEHEGSFKKKIRMKNIHGDSDSDCLLPWCFFMWQLF